ncbi:MAG: ribosome maturation factor RimP [Solirubrobacteraceae bacterium]
MPSETKLTTINSDIGALLASGAPDVELLLAEVVSGDTLRVFIDHPDGVTLAHCEQVTSLLETYREHYTVEVSSPGPDRPLTKPQHFRRFVGRHVRLRLRELRDGRAPDAKRLVSVTGELVDASDDGVTVAVPEGIVTIPYVRIARSNLVPGD